MQPIGHPARPLIARVAWPALGAIAAILPALWMRGFTVDDALISVRYARHLAQGVGWRFNAGAASTDGVTPLPWPVVLLPLAGAGPVAVLARAQLLGAVVWVATGAALGRAVGRVVGAAWWMRCGLFVLLAMSVPVAAYAVSGMETPLATALATAAALLSSRPRAVALLAGLAASLRPELVPWAVALSVGCSLVRGETLARGVRCAAIALAPFALCALVRAVAWGSPAPLALMAKPSDLAHGLPYAGAACVVTLVPLAAFSLAVRRASFAMAIAAAGLVHAATIAAIGGDWMPYARLMVPVVPSLVYAAALASPWMHPLAAGVRLGVAGVAGAALIARGGTDGRRVGADRAALIDAARPALAGARRVAALDIGWVSAATEGDIIDLAGVTDPRIAALPGGHTSKRVDGPLLVSLEPDIVLLYALQPPPGGLTAWRDATYTRAIEARLASDDTVAARFDAVSWLPLGVAGAGYVVLSVRSRPQAFAAP
jgi:hypothetical protein